jgi:hypothetical protein
VEVVEDEDDGGHVEAFVIRLGEACGGIEDGLAAGEDVVGAEVFGEWSVARVSFARELDPRLT